MVSGHASVSNRDECSLCLVQLASFWHQDGMKWYKFGRTAILNFGLFLGKQYIIMGLLPEAGDYRRTTASSWPSNYEGQELISAEDYVGGFWQWCSVVVYVCSNIPTYHGVFRTRHGCRLRISFAFELVEWKRRLSLLAWESCWCVCCCSAHVLFLNAIGALIQIWNEVTALMSWSFTYR